MPKDQKKVPPLPTHDTLQKLYTKPFFNLTNEERKVLNKYYTAKKFTFSINPYALRKIQPSVEQYLMFIDARINKCYLQIKEWLEKNKHRVSSHFLTGDADFIIEYLATPTSNDKIKREIYQLLQLAPRDKMEEKLIDSFTILKTLISKRTDNDYAEKQEYDYQEEDIAKIELLQRDYQDKTAIAQFGSQKKMQNFLQQQKDNQIILGYYISGEPAQSLIKAYILLLYAKNNFEHLLLREKYLRKKIVDFHSIRINDGDIDFYRHANYLIISEFATLKEYHEWKEYLYAYAQTNNEQINVMTFIIENTISELPVSIGNISLFDEISRAYNQGANDKVLIGHPYYFDSLKSQYKICLYTKSLREHGMLIGEPGSGKTFTAMILAKKFFDKKIRVHFIDSSGGIVGKLNEVFPTVNKQEILHNQEISAQLLSEFSFSEAQRIYFYQPNATELPNLVLAMLKKIVQMQNPDESRITRDVIWFEEAQLLFNNEAVKKALSETITIAGRKGVSLWFSTQKLSYYPRTLISNLRNRIIHKVDTLEKREVAELLINSGEDILYDDLEKELTQLQKGDAIVSLVFPEDGQDRELSPIKIRVGKE